jgi:hypothetical protein
MEGGDALPFIEVGGIHGQALAQHPRRSRSGKT